MRSVVKMPARDWDRRTTELAKRFHLLADPSRLRVLLILTRDGETNVGDLAAQTGLTQPAVSHHLQLLRLAGLAGFRRAGKCNYYAVDPDGLGDLMGPLRAAAGR